MFSKCFARISFVKGVSFFVTRITDAYRITLTIRPSQPNNELRKNIFFTKKCLWNFVF